MYFSGSVWAELHFSLNKRSCMTPIFNHSLVKGEKNQLMLHLWKAQTSMASGVGAGIPTLKATCSVVCGPPASAFLHGHCAHLGLAVGVSLAAGAVQGWIYSPATTVGCSSSNLLLSSLHCASYKCRCMGDWS